MALTVDELNLQIVAEYEAAIRAIDSLENRLSRLLGAYNRLNRTGKTTTNTMKNFNTVVSKTTNAINKNQNAINKSGGSFSKFTDKLTRQISKWRTLHGAVKSVANKFGEAFNASNDYIETLNLFTVTMGEATESALAYAESVQKLVGIDVADWMKYQGTFKQLTAGYGVADEAANKMSKNLTQLSYDLASFFNTDVETAFDKLSSAMSGQVKGLREFGIDTTVASLQQYALSKGIEQSVSTMTQAEKSLLRYNYIMERSTKIQGDMARTLVTPANALRILSSLLQQLKRAFGNIVSVLVAEFIPYIQAMVSVLIDAANAIAAFFNFTIPTIDYSNLGNNGLPSVLDDAEESAGGVSDKVKEIKKQLMGFDELNIINNPDTGSGGGGSDSGIGGGLNMDLYEYDFLENLETTKLDEIKEKMKDILWYSGAIVAAFAGWKLGGLIVGLIEAIKKAGGLKAAFEAAKKSASGLSGMLGGALLAGGLVIYIKGFSTAWGEGLSAENVVELLGGSAAMIAGGALVGKIIGAALGKSLIGALVGGGLFAAVAGGGIFFTGLKDALTNGLDWLSAILIPAGSTIAGAGIGAIIGALGGPIGMGLGALIGVVVGALTDLGVLIYQNWDAITNWLSEKCGFIGEFFSKMWTGISTKAAECWNAIVTFFTPAFEWFSQLFGSIKQTISDVFYNVGVIARGCWEVIKAVWGIVSQWFSTNVIQPVATFFSGLWDGFVAAAKTAWDAVKGVFSTVAKFFGDIFSTAWQKVVKVFSIAGEIFVNIKDAIVSAFKVVVNGIIRGLNRVIAKPFNAINGVLAFLREVSILGLRPFSSLRNISIPEIPLLASGGMVNTGQMFIAREAGPELVGQIGSKTSVANNQQIISGIEAGVYRAMMAANGNGGKPVQITVVTDIDGDVVARKYVEYHNGYVVQTGESPILI